MDMDKFQEALVFIRGAIKDIDTWDYVAQLLSEALDIDLRFIL